VSKGEAWPALLWISASQGRNPQLLPPDLPSPTQPISVLYAVISIAGEAKCLRKEHKECKESLQKAGFSANKSTDDETDECNVEEHGDVLSQATSGNVKANYSNIVNEVERKVDTKEIDEFTEKHQQIKEEEDDGRRKRKEKELLKKNFSTTLVHNMML
jgi:hypothetical protein